MKALAILLEKQAPRNQRMAIVNLDPKQPSVVYWLDDDDHPDVKPGTQILVEFEPQDQFAKIVTSEISHAFTPGQWYVMADPVWAGKHPSHNARYVVNCVDIEVDGTDSIDSAESRQWRFAKEEGAIICTLPDSPNQEANASLIARAPRLLAALQELLTASEIVDGQQVPDPADVDHLLRCHDQARATLAAINCPKGWDQV
jgi:hypothetical protein